MDDHEKTLAEHAERPRRSGAASIPRPPSARRPSNSGSRRSAAAGGHSNSFRPASRGSSRRAVAAAAAAVAAAATRHSSFRRTSRSSSRRPSSQAPRPSGGGGVRTAGQDHQSFLDYLRRESLRPPPPIELDLKDFEDTFSTFTPADGVDEEHDWHDESALGHSGGGSSSGRKPPPLQQSPSPRPDSPGLSCREEGPEEPRPASPDYWEGWVDEQNASIEVAPPPDGGARAWLAVLGAWCCLFCSFGWISCIGTFHAQYQQNELKEHSLSAVAWITSVEVRFFQRRRFGLVSSLSLPFFLLSLSCPLGRVVDLWRLRCDELMMSTALRCVSVHTSTRKNLQRSRPRASCLRWHFPSRLWLNDGVSVDRILSIYALAVDLQRHWCLGYPDSRSERRGVLVQGSASVGLLDRLNRFPGGRMPIVVSRYSPNPLPPPPLPTGGLLLL